MPPWLRAAARLNPVTHLVTASRGLMSGTATAGQVEWALAAAAALAAIFAPWRCACTATSSELPRASADHSPSAR